MAYAFDRLGFLQFEQLWTIVLEDRRFEDPSADALDRVLRRMSAVMPSLAERADRLRLRFERIACAGRRTERQITDWPRPRDRSNDVLRVLRDL